MHPPVIDCHAHIGPSPYPARDEWLKRIFSRCDQYNIEAIVFSLLAHEEGRPEMDPEELKALAEAYEVRVECALGFSPPGYKEDLKNPHRWRQAHQEALESVASYLKKGVAVAVGEVGLDYFWPLASYLQIYEDISWNEVNEEVEKRFDELMAKEEVQVCIKGQKEVFRDWIDLACEFDLPLVIHDRDAFEDIFSILEKSPIEGEKVVFHCYNSTGKNARRAAEKGYWISLPASAIKRESFREAARGVPLEKALIETDSPYQSPIRGVWSRAYGEAKKAVQGKEMTSKVRQDWIKEKKEEIFFGKMEEEFPNFEGELYKKDKIKPVEAQVYFASGKRRNQNEPTFVRWAARAIAEVKGIDYEEVCRQTRANARRFFRL